MKLVILGPLADVDPVEYSSRPDNSHATFQANGDTWIKIRGKEIYEGTLDPDTTSHNRTYSQVMFKGDDAPLSPGSTTQRSRHALRLPSYMMPEYSSEGRGALALQSNQLSCVTISFKINLDSLTDLYPIALITATTSSRESYYVVISKSDLNNMGLYSGVVHIAMNFADGGLYVNGRLQPKRIGKDTRNRKTTAGRGLVIEGPAGLELSCVALGVMPYKTRAQELEPHPVAFTGCAFRKITAVASRKLQEDVDSISAEDFNIGFKTTKSVNSQITTDYEPMEGRKAMGFTLAMQYRLNRRSPSVGECRIDVSTGEAGRSTLKYDDLSSSTDSSSFHTATSGITLQDVNVTGFNSDIKIAEFMGDGARVSVIPDSEFRSRSEIEEQDLKFINFKAVLTETN